MQSLAFQSCCCLRACLRHRPTRLLVAASSSSSSFSTSFSSYSSLSSPPAGSIAFQDLVTKGYSRWSNALSAAATRSLLNALWEDYGRRFGVSRTDPTKWLTRHKKEARYYGPLPDTMFQSSCPSPSPSKSTPPLDSLRPFPRSNEFEELEHCVDRFARATLGPLLQATKRRLSCRRSRAVLFVNCPRPGAPWMIPTGWHTDLSVDPDCLELSFVYVFAYLDDVDSEGGATVVLENSVPRIALEAEVLRKNGKHMMKRLAAENNWFADLFDKEAGFRSRCRADPQKARDEVSRFFSEGTISLGIQMKLAELSGKSGDLVLWDPRTFHSPSGNNSDRPRSVIRFRIDLLPIDSKLHWSFDEADPRQ